MIRQVLQRRPQILPSVRISTYAAQNPALLAGLRRCLAHPSIKPDFVGTSGVFVSHSEHVERSLVARAKRTCRYSWHRLRVVIQHVGMRVHTNPWRVRALKIRTSTSTCSRDARANGSIVSANNSPAVFSIVTVDAYTAYSNRGLNASATRRGSS